jgi:hypothetical protein
MLLTDIWELNACSVVSFLINQILGDANGFKYDSYWSSTESDALSARNHFFGIYRDSGGCGNNKYSCSYRVRAVRRF